MIAIIDYDIGNLGSVLKAFRYLGLEARLTRDFNDLRRAAGIILPGVGAFGQGMCNLREMGFEPVIKDEIAGGKPFFGICLGMQLLLDGSEEAEGIQGLGLIPGLVKKFNRSKVGKIPHMGWNQIEIVKQDPVFSGLSGENFYFVHSFYASPETENNIVGKTRYGDTEFASVVRKENVWGMQCHPEKSSKLGLKVLKNFSEVVYGGDNTGN